jgi:RES domain-containing protein
LRVWRVAPRPRSAFDGEGARRAGGRWNEKGVSVVYTSATLALAALEYFVNADPVNSPADLVARPAQIPDDLLIKTVSISDLPRNWRNFPAPEELRMLGTKWAQSMETVASAVPSAVIPQENNYLLNPLHSDFSKIVVGEPEPFSFDLRMWKTKS